jgi:CRP/FNR family transcriptional regulator, cyclic AMP receptor protein
MDTTVLHILEEFFSKYRLRHYPKGQILILDEEILDYTYYLTSGRVKAYDTSYRGAEIILSIYGPYNLFPIAPLVDKPNRFIYQAQTDIEVRQAPLADTIQFLEGNPKVVYSLMGVLHGRVDEVLHRMSYLMASSAKKRLMYELTLECRYFSIPREDGTYCLMVSEREIGARVGLSRETVSREINKLKREHLVETQPGKIIVLNVAELEKRMQTIV